MKLYEFINTANATEMTYSAASTPRAFPAHRTVCINSSFQWKNIFFIFIGGKNECLESAMRNYKMSQYALILQNLLALLWKE